MSRDRFEALVAKVSYLPMAGMGPMVLRSTAIRLLKREHNALVRAVKRLRDTADETLTTGTYGRGRQQALDDVLALLAKRKGRTQ